jgi:hypothetical protein
MRKLIHCNTCNPNGTERNIWDCDLVARARTCRCCGTTVPMRAQNKAVAAKREALADMFEQMIAKLSA